ncbi:helix-turn-helix domain-containing protein [Geobacter benzoatilyticus]|uniref:Cupin domain-containing protein n=1 Tax=Geobacter benzoatilyticus TaxID=2815309 RepID=A0ABX7Q6N3_9BACT|nr:cupin domain-containing protein [Geobacter benzoatilyticus]QSV46847.1 cupin domain-containing protein [Geobacter benzoatilyticus]
MEDIKSKIKELRLGEKIRKLRQERRLTLQELSDLSSLSKPLLSQIENDQVTPPIATLLKISKGLKVGINYFFEEEEDQQKLVLTRASQQTATLRRTGNDAPHGYTYRSLAPGMRHKPMEPFLVEFELTAWDDRFFYRHDGFELIYLLEGELEFHYGTDVMRLNPGDSIYYDSSEPHGYVSVGETKATAVAVLYSKN